MLITNEATNAEDGEGVRFIALGGDLTIESGDPESPAKVLLSDAAGLTELAVAVAAALHDNAAQLTALRARGQSAHLPSDVVARAEWASRQLRLAIAKLRHVAAPPVEQPVGQ